MKKRYIFFFILISSAKILPVTIYEYFIQEGKSTKTEYTAYNLLKNSYLSDNINYIAIPWHTLMHHNGIPKLTALNLHFDQGFTICQNQDYKKIAPIAEKMGIDTIFTPHAHQKKIGKVTIVPFPHYPINGIGPAEKKDIWYSFIGTAKTHKCRKVIAKMAHDPSAVVIIRKEWHLLNDPKVKARNTSEYRDILSRSRFSLCPRGSGHGTFRFWESLQAGAIPILIADGFILPPGFEWDQAIIQIPEKNIPSFLDVLKTISPEKEYAMREKCLEAFDHFCRGNNFIKVIEEYYEALER